MKKRLIILSAGIFFIFLLVAPPVLADEPVNVEEQALNQLGSSLGDPEGEHYVDPRLVVAKVIQVLLMLLGTIFLILFCLSGYWFFTAKGDEEKAKKGLDTAKRAVFGLIIILMAYGIVTYVMAGLEKLPIKTR